MNNSNAIERLSNIFCLLQNNGHDASIKHISKALNIPRSVIRADIKALLKNSTFSSYFDEELFDIEMYDEDDLPYIDDDTILYLESTKFQISDGLIPLYITHREKELLAQYYPELVDRSNKKLYLIKDAPTKLDINKDDLCTQIQSAIDNNYYIKFTYRNTKNGSLKTYELAPKLIYNNTINGRMYMITLRDNDDFTAWRFDRIFSATTIDHRIDTTPVPEKVSKRFDYLWAMDNDQGNDPVHVKIRIDGFSRNIIEKIKNDILRRKYAKLYQEGDYWYYEDDIIGLSSFRSWIYRYGSSMVVMEPVELAREVYNSAVEKLKRYKGER